MGSKSLSIMSVSPCRRLRHVIYPMEKVVLAIMHATRKLPHYFQAHTVVVLTQLPLQSLL